MTQAAAANNQPSANQPSTNPPPANPRGVNPFTRSEKLDLTIGSAISIIFFFEAGRWFRIPAYPDFSASLLQQPTLFGSIIVTLVVTVISVLAGATIAGRVRLDAGLFCTSVGLFILSLRGGPIRYALFEANSPHVLFTLCVETIVLSAILIAGYFTQRSLSGIGLIVPDDAIDLEGDAPNSIAQHLLGLGCNVIVIFVIMLLLAQSDRKAQVAVSLVVACFVGACVGYYVAPAPRSVWCWSGPLIAGAIGYLVNDLAGPLGWQIGEIHGTFAPLARPMPLDYAGIGVAASILGYWSSRQWSHNHEHDTVPENAAENAT